MPEHKQQESQSILTEEQSYKAPEWAKHIIWYQIFPERFRNGDPDNDPTRERVGGPEGWELSPWTGDWYERAEWEKSLGATFRSGVFKRRYGGDLQGIIDKLDYLQDLGVSGLYLNPIFDAVSLHKYDSSCYHHVDRFFGPDPEGDVEIMKQEDPRDPSTWQWTSADKLLLKLIDEVHKRNMRIILDGVFNHTGTDFWAFRDLADKQQQSEYKDWYSIKTFRNSENGNSSEFDYDCWWGVKSLPEFKEVDGTLVEPVREHIFAITKRWMDPDGDGDPSDGIDGWRLDVPDMIGKEFWKEWSALVRQINPDAYTVGEIWTTKGKEWINGELFTATMNYPFLKAIQKYMIDQAISPSEFMSWLRSIRETLPDEAEHVQQNLVESHDTPRIASMIINPHREFDTKTTPEEGFDGRKPNADERRLQRLIALFQFTYVGAPMLYYGTEAGMWGADDPDDRKPMLWKDYDYEPEQHHPLGKQRPTDENTFDERLFSWYKKLANIRNEHKALQTGHLKELLIQNDQNMLAFARVLNSYMFCLVAVNRSEAPQKFRIPLMELEIAEDKHLENVITGSRVKIDEHHAIVTLPPVSGAVIAPKS